MTFFLAALAAGAEEPVPLPSGRFHFEKTIRSDLGYILRFPKEYKPGSGKRWPLVMFLHGVGQRGTNISDLFLHGPPKLAATGMDLPYVLLAPQCAPDQYWQNDVLLALLDRIVAEESIDKDRVYLTGLSMGGYATWYLGMKHPERFAALAPICGGGQVLDVVLADSRSEELKQMPVWAIHGADDSVVPASESEQMVLALRKLGNRSAKLTVYPGVGHDSWTQTYDDPKFFEWMLAQTRSGRFVTPVPK